MKSIKPGRGPSAMGAIGSVFAGIFGIIWTIATASMGAPIYFVFFGIVFVLMAIVQGIYHFKNTTGQHRMSLFDITYSRSEPDPLNQMFRKETSAEQSDRRSHGSDEINFCPYCGGKISDPAYQFCPQCGKDIR